VKASLTLVRQTARRQTAKSKYLYADGQTAQLRGHWAKPGEIRALFKQTLGVDRSREIKEQMLAAGLPM